VKKFSTFPQALVLWKCQDCRNCGNPFRIPTNCLENSSSFPQSFGKAKKQLFHIPTKPIILLIIMIYIYGNYNRRQWENIFVADH